MFHGSIVALVTPMNEDGSLDEKGLESLLGFHLDNGTDAIVSMGTTGESATFSHKEHRAVIKRTVEIVAGKVPVIAGTGSNCTREALELTQSSMQDGADAALLVTPYYNKPTQEGLYRHHKLIAEQAALPQILYNVPGRTACDMLPETVERLSDFSNIVAIKEATGDMARAKDIMQRCGERIDVISGDDATAMELILNGAKGDISVTANVAPKAMHEMCKAALVGDRETAERINNTLLALHQDLFVEANPIPVKYAVYKLGFGANTLRLPMLPLAEQYEALVDAAMKAAE